MGLSLIHVFEHGVAVIGLSLRVWICYPHSDEFCLECYALNFLVCIVVATDPRINAATLYVRFG
jgi:hypothetical protein